MPKTVNRGGIVGFTNMLVRLWEQEQPRAVVVGWDTLTAPTYRHEAFELINRGATSTTRCSSSSTCCRSSFGRSALPPRRGGYEADDFVAAAVRSEEKRKEAASSSPQIATSFSLRPSAP